MPTASQTAPSPARRPRVSTAVGRYRRWHVETRTDGEEEGWLLTYLDVITLILVLMVVMLSVAEPGKGKDGDSDQAASVAPQAPTTHTLNGLALDTLGKNVDVAMSKDAVRFRFSSDVLFESGSASFAAEAKPALDQLIPMLNANPSLNLVVEGHTDSLPIQSERYPSNWELSTGRAAAVARYLIDQGVAPQRVQASGFADTRPLGARDNPVDQILNRRVELTMELAPSKGSTPP